MHTTNLRNIRKHNPCSNGWSKLLKSLPPEYDTSAPISFEHILSSNGINDTLWCLRVLDDPNPQAEAFALECLGNIEKTTVSPEEVEVLKDYVKRNRERVLRTDYWRMAVRDYILVAHELESEDQAIALFRKHFCTPGVIYGPTYPAE